MGCSVFKMYIKKAGLEMALPALVESDILQKKQNMQLVST